MLSKEELLKINDENIINTYGKRSLILVKGKASCVWDIDGNKYLDFLTGISVNNVGHCHPKIVKTIKKQAETLIHCSNLYYIEPQIMLAEKLCSLSFADKAFFANSGAEVNEAAIKLARRYSSKKTDGKRYEIITMKNSFHGRTLAAITATGQEVYHKGFEPMVPGFVYAEYNDLHSVKELINDKTCAIMVEPVQGEGGVVPATKEFLEGVRAICDQKGLLLIFDEVQCGLGRCGEMFAYQRYGVAPDIMTLAKSLGGGLPIGAMLCTNDASFGFDQGSHAATFGGNPLVCAAANTMLDILVEEKLPENAKNMGEYIKAQLKKKLKGLDFVKEIRGLGLMVGIVLDKPGADYVKAAQEKGLLLGSTKNNVVRMLPPLNIKKKDADTAIKIIIEVLKNT